MLRAKGIRVVGIDPTEELLGAARRRDSQGEYQIARAESLPFSDASFDLVVSYLTLIDIADFRAALKEMVRVMSPRGVLLIANINSFITSCPMGWIKDQDSGSDDRYLEEFSGWVEWSGIRIKNWHRPLSSYIRELLALGLTLTFFDEPEPQSGDDDHRAQYRRAPWFMIMEWQR
jgi:SAM-dependent methyltransferase